jgi:hypothetical protein
MINVIGTVNEVEAVFNIEDEDRRNIIFKTIDSDSDPERYWRDYSKKINNDRENPDFNKAIAWILERVNIDWDLIQQSYKTRGYSILKEEQTSAINPVYDWAKINFIEYKKTKSKMNSADLYKDFKITNPNVVKTQNKFTKLLNEALDTGAFDDFGFKITAPGNVKTLNFGE